MRKKDHCGGLFVMSISIVSDSITPHQNIIRITEVK
jgi:hypothetical protein